MNPDVAAAANRDPDSRRARRRDGSTPWPPPGWWVRPVCKSDAVVRSAEPVPAYFSESWGRCREPGRRSVWLEWWSGRWWKRVDHSQTGVAGGARISEGKHPNSWPGWTTVRLWTWPPHRSLAVVPERQQRGRRAATAGGQCHAPGSHWWSWSAVPHSSAHSALPGADWRFAECAWCDGLELCLVEPCVLLPDWDVKGAETMTNQSTLTECVWLSTLLLEQSWNHPCLRRSVGYAQAGPNPSLREGDGQTASTRQASN